MWALVLIIGVLVGVCITAISLMSSETEETDGGFGRIVEYGEMVYYIPFTGKKFANNLCKFLRTNIHLEVAGMTGDNSGAYGTNNGFFVVFRNKLPQ